VRLAAAAASAVVAANMPALMALRGGTVRLWHDGWRRQRPAATAEYSSDNDAVGGGGSVKRKQTGG